jgi:hypothetical protein
VTSSADGRGNRDRNEGAGTVSFNSTITQQGCNLREAGFSCLILRWGQGYLLPEFMMKKGHDRVQLWRNIEEKKTCIFSGKITEW